MIAFFVILACVDAAAPPPSAEAATPLPRIGVRAGAFIVQDTGARFVPRGFNHTVLEEGRKGWHATFNTGVYDPEAMERALAEMASLGANVIRVWIWGAQKESGFTGGKESRGLNAAYMENVVDFLRRATRRGLYVIPILDETPHNAHYDEIAKQEGGGEDARITGYNRQYLTRGLIAAKAAAIQDFLRYIQGADPGLLRTVLGWSLANEVFVSFQAGPFREKEGQVVTAAGNSYDLSDTMQRRACYDASILYWANTLADAVKTVDPEAMVTAGMWTSDAHGRPPVNGLWPDGKDPRIPPRPSVLGGPASRLDFIDVHVYPWDGTSTVRREAHEHDAVTKPALVGEYGVFKNKTPEEARPMLREMLAQAYAMGYAGDLYWIWDLQGVEGQTWSAVEEGVGAYVMGLPRP